METKIAGLQKLEVGTAAAGGAFTAPEEEFLFLLGKKTRCKSRSVLQG